MSSYQQVRYAGWRRERQGRFFGLQGWQALAVLALAVPTLVAFSASRWLTGLAFLAAAVPVAALVAVPVRGRPAVVWVRDALTALVGNALGWTTFRSATSTDAGTDVDLDEPDLPGTLARVRFHDGPPFGSTATPVCVIHDPARNRWAATAAITHPGTNRSDGAERDAWASGLGSVLAGAAVSEMVARVSLQLRTVPDDGTERAAWVQDNLVDHAPPVAAAAVAAMDHLVAGTAVRYEGFVTVAVDGDRIRKQAKEAGGGVTGRARVLYRHLQEVEAALQAAGVTKVTWLDSQGLATAIRTGFNPTAAPELGRAAQAAARRPGVVAGVPWAASGPSAAPAPSPRSYSHDGCTSVSYTVLMPDRPVSVGAMAPLMRGGGQQVRRSLTMHYEPIPTSEALRQAEAATWADDLSTEVKHTRGFKVSRMDQRRVRENAQHEQALTNGHAAVRVAGAFAVTVPAGTNVEDAAASAEADARRCRYVLRRLDLAQDSGFVAAAIPVGVGMADRSGR